MSYHNPSRADVIMLGAVNYPPYHAGRGSNDKGVDASVPYLHEFGAPIAADPDYLIDAATSTELPDTETVSYVVATADGTTPLDNADTVALSTLVAADGETYTVYALDVPRNITVTTTHSSSVVAMTITVKGFDVYGEYMEEDIEVAATGTSQSDAGLKAFAYILQIDITAAADAEANTCNIGVGDVLGLPLRVDKKHRVVPFSNGALDASATIVVADDTTATATTGDVRGTVDFNDASDASKEFAVWIMPYRDTKANAFGVAQYGG